MKKINKFLSVFLALIMIISIIPMSTITASASTPSLTLVADKTTVDVGDVITVTVNLAEKSGLGVLTIKVNYDSSVLRATDMNAGNLGATVNIKTGIATMVSASTFEEAGTVCVMKFEVIEAVESVVSITILEAIDNDYDSMDVTVNSLIIKPTVDEPTTEPDDSCIHIPGEVIRRINPTCTENGWEESVCSICSETFISRAPVIKKWIDDSLYPETEHPYDWEAEDVYTINYPDADFIEITFSNDFYFWEDRNDSGDADWLYVYDYAGTFVERYTGTDLAGKTITISGDSVKLEMHCMFSCEYGFKIESIYAGYIYDEPDLIATGHNYSNGVCTICGITNTNKCGDNVYWDFDESTGTLTISGTGEMDNYDYYNQPWANLKENIVNVVIEDGVISVGGYAFVFYHNIQNVDIGEDVSVIYDCAFDGCSNLTEVNIPDSVTVIERYAFSGCSFEEVEISEYVTYIGNEAFGRGALKNINVSENNNYYSSIDGVLFNKDKTSLIFYPPYHSESYTIPDGVLNIKRLAFVESVITDIIISKDVEFIEEDAFWAAHELQKINVVDENNNFSSIDGILFNKDKTTLLNYPCKKDDVTSYVVPDTVTKIGSFAFYWCRFFEEIILPDNLKIIGDCAFYWCDNISEIQIPDTVTVIGYRAFDSCLSLLSIEIPDGVESIDYGLFMHCESLESVVLPDSIKTIEDSAFYNCPKLTDVYYYGTQDNWNEIEQYDEAQFAEVAIHFNYVPGHFLKEVTKVPTCTEAGELTYTCVCNIVRTESIPATGHNFVDNVCQVCGITDFPSGTCGENVTWVYDESTGTLTITGTGAMYDYDYDNPPWEEYVDDITSVVINDGVTTICDYAFYCCESLTSVTIGDSVTSIGDYAFSDCDSLTSVIIPDSVTSIGKAAFEDCTSLTSITIPDSVTTIEYFAFSRCYSLTNIAVDSNNQYYSNDEYGVLFNKDKTTLIQYPIGNTRISYTIPDSVTVIEDYAFDYCTSLASITIPDSVTTIGDFAFSDCKNLTSVTIPDSVTTIGYKAFSDCTSLTDVYYSGSEEEWSAISIGNYNDPLINATIHYNYIGDHNHSYESVVTPPTCTEQGYTTYTCSCGDSYVSDYVEPTHTLGEWEVVVEPTYEAEGEKVQKCTVCGEIVAEEIIPMIVRVTVTDDNTDVSLEFDSDNYNGEVEIVVEESFDGTAFDIIDTSLNASQKVMYDITMTVDGVETQPNGTITVKIPLPSGYNPNRSFVYHIDTVTGKVEKMPAKYENGYLVFETTHFSYYAVVEEDLTDAPKVVVSQKTLAIVGKQVKVAVSLENNPGITSMLLKVNYDTDKLQLVSVEDSGNLGAAYHSNVLNSPYTLSWANDTATENIAYNGEVVVLTFNVLEDAELGETPITVTYDYNNYDIIDKDMNLVEFVVVDGIVNIIDVIIGDVNEDGKVNTLDRVILTRYIAKWEEYPEGSINTVAADVNCDGKVNTLDRVILTRYIAKWEGYETLPYVG